MNTDATESSSPEMLQYPCETRPDVNYESENGYSKSPPARIYTDVVSRPNSKMH